jgi:hypothetical protein
MNYCFLRTLSIIIALLITSIGFSQTNSKPKAIAAPDWVKAIDNPDANYYKAVKEYNDFWIGKEKPDDEEHLMNKGTENVKEHTKKLSKKELKQLRLQDYYRYECKRFENWMYVNKAYVQHDGHILNADERLKLWEQTQKDR